MDGQKNRWTALSRKAPAFASVGLIAILWMLSGKVNYSEMPAINS